MMKMSMTASHTNNTYGEYDTYERDTGYREVPHCSISAHILSDLYHLHSQLQGRRLDSKHLGGYLMVFVWSKEYIVMMNKDLSNPDSQLDADLF